LAILFSALDTALAQLIAAILLMTLTMVVVMRLALGLIRALLLRWRVIAGHSVLAIFLQMTFSFDRVKLYYDCYCHANNPGSG
jgi:hypothetical protein